MNARLVWIFLVSMVCASTYAQKNIEDDYFRNPLDITTILSGTFGELRSNHFHSGLDIKTQGKTGLKVYASADGYISRIKIQHYGYGKAIYIAHPNGYTTVYAHLKKLGPGIEEYIKKQQYAKESYEIEVFPEPNALPVKKGDVIAYTGNTGSSGGPHLHFEIRDKSERPMNPFLFGIDVKDTRKPNITRLYAYPLDENSHINGSANPSEIRLTQLKDGNYRAETVKARGRIGFGLTTNDRQDLANNRNGIYSIDATANGRTLFQVKMDKFSFAETRYLNRMIDYGFYKRKRSRIQKLFIEPNNPLSIYGKVEDRGELFITDSLTYEYKLSIKDFKNNTVKISVPIQGVQDSIIDPKKVNSTEHYLKENQPYTYTKGRWEVYFPKGCLYENAYLDLNAQGDALGVHNDEVPLHKNITISYDLDGYSDEDCEKLFIGRKGFKPGEVYYTGARIRDGRLTARTRTMGDYTIGMDKIAPKVTPIDVNDGKWMSKYRYLTLKIVDEDSGIKSYRATVNGKFILMEYEYKKDMLTYDFNDAAVTDTKNDFKLIVTDNVGNSTTFTTTFYRKN